MKTTILIGVLFAVGFLYSCQRNRAENEKTTLVTEAPEVEGSATEIAKAWCDLMHQEFRAKNGTDADQIATTEKVVKDYQKKIELKFADDPAMIESIIGSMASCDAALEGRRK